MSQINQYAICMLKHVNVLFPLAVNNLKRRVVGKRERAIKLLLYVKSRIIEIAALFKISRFNYSNKNSNFLKKNLAKF